MMPTAMHSDSTPEAISVIEGLGWKVDWIEPMWRPSKWFWLPDYYVDGLVLGGIPGFRLIVGRSRIWMVHIVDGRWLRWRGVKSVHVRKSLAADLEAYLKEFGITRKERIALDERARLRKGKMMP